MKFSTNVEWSAAEEQSAFATVLGEVVAEQLAVKETLIPLTEAVYQSPGRSKQKLLMQRIRQLVLSKMAEGTDPLNTLTELANKGTPVSSTAANLLETIDIYKDGKIAVDGIDRLATIGKYCGDEVVGYAATKVLEDAVTSGILEIDNIKTDIYTDANPEEILWFFNNAPDATAASLLRAHAIMSKKSPEIFIDIQIGYRQFIANGSPEPEQKLNALSVLLNTSENAIEPQDAVRQ